MADSLDGLTGDPLMEEFDEVRGATIKGLALRYSLNFDDSLDVIHRALVRFLRDTPDEDLLSRGKTEA